MYGRNNPLRIFDSTGMWSEEWGYGYTGWHLRGDTDISDLELYEDNYENSSTDDESIIQIYKGYKSYNNLCIFSAPDETLKASFYQKYVGTTVGLILEGNDYDNTKPGLIMPALLDIEVNVSGTVEAFIYDDTMWVNVNIIVNPYTRNYDFNLTLAASASVCILDDKGLSFDKILEVRNKLQGPFVVDSSRFSLGLTKFETGYPVFGKEVGSRVNKNFLFDLPKESIIDTQPDTLRLVLDLDMGVYSNDKFVWPLKTTDSIVEIDFDKPGGANRYKK